MARSYDEYSEEERGSLRRAMELVNPEYFSRVQENADALEKIQEVIDDAEELRTNLISAQHRTRHDRVVEKAGVVQNERSGALDGVNEETRIHLMSHDAILQEAKKRVRLDEQRELQAIDRFVEERANKIANEAQQPEQTEGEEMSETEKQSHLKADIHGLVDKAVQARFQAAKLHNAQRAEMIEQARINGDEHPETTVRRMQRGHYKAIDDQLHADVHAAFLKYGYDPTRQDVEFHARGGEYESVDRSPDQNFDESVDAPSVTVEAEEEQKQ